MIVRATWCLWSENFFAVEEVKFYISKEAKVAAELLAFLCIQEVLGSNFDTENTILS
jgi:hypothetical protein